MKSGRWSFTIFLLASYVAIFNLWLRLSGKWILLSALVSVVILTMLLSAVRRRGHFLNGWDMMFHAVIIMDILIEGLFQEHFGSYWCALGFAACIVAYRLLRRRAVTAQVRRDDLPQIPVI